MARVQASIAASPDPRTQTSPSSAAAGATGHAAATAIKPARIKFWRVVSCTKRPPLFGQVGLTVALDVVLGHCKRCGVECSKCPLCAYSGAVIRRSHINQNQKPT